ncbi:MAG: ribbon-helix-helix protein, CopG family [Candidatus Diapherotrites archaeon]|nr:ribbon-helix-helix protein, CopG family [Candidatus Diapherotrites archaeon]
MRQYVMNVEPALIKEVDEIIRKEKLYSSRNEFIRDAVRSKVMGFRVLKMRRLAKEIRENAIKKGWNGEFPSQEERDKFVRDFLKEKGLPSIH